MSLPSVPPNDPAVLKDVGGGSLLIAWQLSGKNVLIVGGGEVAAQRIESVLVADAAITLLCPAKGLHARTKQLLDAFPDRIKHFDRRFTGPAELHKMDMVLTAIDDSKRSRDIVETCRNAKVPVNAADIPDCCDFYFGSQIRDGPLQIMVSTNGNGPRMASLVRMKVQACLSGNEGTAIKNVGLLRQKLKERAPGVGGLEGRRRMKWMTQLCNEWSMEELSRLDEEAISRILDNGWDNNSIPLAVDILKCSPVPALSTSTSDLSSDSSGLESTPSSATTVSAVSKVPNTPLASSDSEKLLLPVISGFIVGAISAFALSYIRKR